MSFNFIPIYGKIKSPHLSTYFSSYLPLLSNIFRNRITICPKCFTNFKNLCSCLLPWKKDYKYCFLNLQRSNSLESVRLNKIIQLLVSFKETRTRRNMDGESQVLRRNKVQNMTKKIIRKLNGNEMEENRFTWYRIHNIFICWCLIEKHIAPRRTKQHPFKSKSFGFTYNPTNKSQTRLVWSSRSHLL